MSAETKTLHQLAEYVLASPDGMKPSALYPERPERIHDQHFVECARRLAAVVRDEFADDDDLQPERAWFLANQYVRDDLSWRDARPLSLVAGAEWPEPLDDPEAYVLNQRLGFRYHREDGWIAYLVHADGFDGSEDRLGSVQTRRDVRLVERVLHAREEQSRDCLTTLDLP